MLQVPPLAQLYHQVRVRLVLVGPHQLHAKRAVGQGNHEGNLKKKKKQMMLKRDERRRERLKEGKEMEPKQSD
jgi:hypothetical protein